MPPPRSPIRLGPKHLARVERERLVSRLLLIGAGGAMVAAVVLVGVGIAQEEIFLPRRPAATVNGEPITREDLEARAMLARADLIQQRDSTQQMLAFFAGSPEIQASLQQQITEIDAQLENPGLLGRRALEGLIQARLIRQEAERRGITVSEADIDREIAEAFGFFPEGTPTPAPTATVDPTRVAQSTLPPTALPATTAASPTVAPASATPTTGPSPTPRPTPTVFTREAYEAQYREYVQTLRRTLGVEERHLRQRFAESIFRDRLLASFEPEVPNPEEQVWARHILVSEEALAAALKERLAAGESWDELAATHSLDTSNKDRGGDLGWFGRGAMVEPFERAAFEAPIGDVAGPVSTAFGWHLIQVVDRGPRTLDDLAFRTAVERAFSAWLASARAAADLVFDPELVPPTATPAPTDTPPPTES